MNSLVLVFQILVTFQSSLIISTVRPRAIFSKKDFKTKCGIGEVLDAGRKKTQRKRKTSGHIIEKKIRTNKFECLLRDPAPHIFPFSPPTHFISTRSIN